MKPADFFLGKASQYLTEMDAILSNYVKFDDISLSKDSPYAIQEKKVAELKLKTKALFAEFDKGEPFTDRLKEIDKDPIRSFSDDKPLELYKSVLEQFISHINEFRK